MGVPACCTFVDGYLMAALNPKNTMICHPNRFVL
jgi:hypothetical protein